MAAVRRWKAQVVNGRLVLNEATELPDGTELELVPASVLDAPPLTREEEDGLIEALAAAKRGEVVSVTPGEEEGIRKAMASLRRGEGIPFDEVKATLDRLLKS